MAFTFLKSGSQTQIPRGVRDMVDKGMRDPFKEDFWNSASAYD